jgi:hypothetical protein
MEVSYNGNNKGAYFQTVGQSTTNDPYLNGLAYGSSLIGIRENKVDIIQYNNLFSTTELLSNPTFNTSTGRTVGTGRTIGDDGAEHATGNTGTLTSTPSGTPYTTSDIFRCALHIT